MQSQATPLYSAPRTSTCDIRWGMFPSVIRFHEFLNKAANTKHQTWNGQKLMAKHDSSVNQFESLVTVQNIQTTETWQCLSIYFHFCEKFVISRRHHIRVNNAILWLAIIKSFKIMRQHNFFFLGSVLCRVWNNAHAYPVFIIILRKEHAKENTTHVDQAARSCHTNTRLTTP